MDVKHSELIQLLKTRFEKHKNRHANLDWAQVQARLEADPDKLKSLFEMEATGGEPDLVGVDEQSGEFIFFDCSAESPKGRRSLCFDREALDARKEHKPASSALEMAAAMGIQLLTEDDYHYLQQFGPFDSKTSSWQHQRISALWMAPSLVTIVMAVHLSTTTVPSLIML